MTPQQAKWHQRMISPMNLFKWMYRSIMNIKQRDLAIFSYQYSVCFRPCGA